MLTLSLIIPVYNEERHIRHCLDAVAAQTVAPDEVIVVDNNCTDTTIDIVREYGFVRIITEKQQGRGYARSGGFNAARYDILGRIDADSRIEADWVENVKRSFENGRVSGLTGIGKTAFLPGISFVRSTLLSRVYYWIVHAGFNTVTMWGANMAVRRTAWLQVRELVWDSDRTIHEDQDISLWMAAQGLLIVQNNKVKIRTNGQGYRYLPKMIKYSLMFKRTRMLHAENGNLNNPRVVRIGFWKTLPGRIAAMVYAALTTPFILLLFPVDYIVQKVWPKSWWLD